MDRFMIPSTIFKSEIGQNRLFPSCCLILSLFRSESWCSTTGREMSLICIRIRNSFPFEWLCTRTRFKSEVCSNSEMGYWRWCLNVHRLKCSLKKKNFIRFTVSKRKYFACTTPLTGIWSWSGCALYLSINDKSNGWCITFYARYFMLILSRMISESPKFHSQRHFY